MLLTIPSTGHRQAVAVDIREMSLTDSTHHARIVSQHLVHSKPFDPTEGYD
jgi:hypothetical protein